MKKIWTSGAAFAAFTLIGTSQAFAGVVINEIWNGSTTDEWVEFYNNGASSVDVSGWTFVRRTNAATEDAVLYTFPAATTIPAGGYYAIGDSGTGFTLDGTYTNVISTGNQSLALKDSGGNVVDGLGTGTGSIGAGTSAYTEGTVLALTPSAGTSVKRIPNGTDTNNNSADFQRNTTKTFKASNDAVIPATTVADIAAARALANGTEVIISGTVTVTAPSNFASGRNQITVQDGSGADSSSAILIDDQNNVAGQTFAVGQTITNLQGTLGVFNGLKQLVPTKPVTSVGSGSAPAPLVLTNAVTTIDSIESELVTINGVDVAETGVFAVGNYALVTPTGLVITEIRIGTTSPLIGQPIPDGTFSITGVTGQFNGTGQIHPRTAADISETAAVSDWTLY